MEDKRNDAGNIPAAISSTETPKKAPDVPSGEPPSSRRRGGGQKRKGQSLSNLSSPQTTSSSKRRARERASLLSFPQIHNGPCTRARQQPNLASEAAENSASAVRSELEAAAGTPESREAKVEPELSSAAREDYEALEAKIEAEYEVIRSRYANAHVVPIHCVLLQKNISTQNIYQENEKNRDSLREETELLVSSNDEGLEISHASKEPDVVTDEKVESTLLIKSGNEDLPKEQEPTNADESGGTYTVELPPSSPEESEYTKLEGAPSQSTEASEESNKDKMLPSPSKEAPKDEMMISDSLPSETKEWEQMVTSDFMAEIGENTEKREAKDCKNDNKNPAEIKNDIYIGKIKRSAVTAISAAAVKAKIIASQEEDQIRHLATLLVEKQLHKLEAKLAFFREIDSLVMRVRELLERSKQRLNHERAQIIVTRLGISASSSRPMPQSLPTSSRPIPQSLPVNRAATLFANSAARSPGSMTFQRASISRLMMASAPPTTNTSIFYSCRKSSSALEPGQTFFSWNKVIVGRELVDII